MTLIKTLLLTGANNHDWRRSAPLCKRLLEGSGRFSVDVSEDPSATLADARALTAYGLFLLDYNGPDWGEEAKRSFMAAVRGGTGVVALHASNNAFPDWPEYGEMVALTWRRGTSGHSAFHAFEVRTEDPSHPVMRGLEGFGTHDELYHEMVPAPGVSYRVLASAYSDPAAQGTGRREPVMLVLEHGKGRVFHLLLGHVWPKSAPGTDDAPGSSTVALDNGGFQHCLVRGSEWAATGAVTP